MHTRAPDTSTACLRQSHQNEWRYGMNKLLIAPLLIGMSSSVCPCICRDNRLSSPGTSNKETRDESSEENRQRKLHLQQLQRGAASGCRAKTRKIWERPISKVRPSIIISCELGNKITTYYNASDDKHIAIRWKDIRSIACAGRHQYGRQPLSRIASTAWYGSHIPSKAMLLDSQ
jgi:hypothetical protein